MTTGAPLAQDRMWSPCQRIQIERAFDLEGKKKLGRDLAGIEDPEPPPSARRT